MLPVGFYLSSEPMEFDVRGRLGSELTPPT
jgi:hypothetical protein